MHQPLTYAKLQVLKGQLQKELSELFPEYAVSNLRVTVPERNSIEVRANIGNQGVQFLGNPATLNALQSQLRRALTDLGMIRRS